MGRTCCQVGGRVASWLVHSTPEWAVRVRALAGDILLCSWARHFTLTVPLCSPPRCINGQWQNNCWGNLTNCRGVARDGLASRPGKVEILLAASCYRNPDTLWQLWASMQCPLLFGELEAGKRKRSLWASSKRTLKENLHWCSIQLKELKAVVNDRTHWHSFTAVSSFEDNHHQRLMATFVLYHRACSGEITLPHLFKTLVF